MKTFLKIRWERDDEHCEEIWERNNDGVLCSLCMAIINLIHGIEKLREKE